jgi:cytoskeletal protein CcmA (bactofilin family)
MVIVTPGKRRGNLIIDGSVIWQQPATRRYATIAVEHHMNTTIGKGITITGTIQAQEAVIIAGTVTGDVLASDFDVTVELGARVEGAVTARSITVRGRSTGRLIAREVVRVQQSARVKADVRSPRLSLEEGASFNGCVEPAKTDAAILVAAYRNKSEAPGKTA